jgi:hypothetical protein
MDENLLHWEQPFYRSVPELRRGRALRRPPHHARMTVTTTRPQQARSGMTRWRATSIWSALRCCWARAVARGLPRRTSQVTTPIPQQRAPTAAVVYLAGRSRATGRRPSRSRRERVREDDPDDGPDRSRLWRGVALAALKSDDESRADWHWPASPPSPSTRRSCSPPMAVPRRAGVRLASDRDALQSAVRTRARPGRGGSCRGAIRPGPFRS